MIDDSREDSSDSLIHLMIGRELCRATGVLSFAQNLSVRNEEISEIAIKLLAKYAVTLPREERSSVGQYSAKIARASLDAKTKDSASMQAELEALRIEAYQVFPRTEAEIRQLIDAKRQLKDLRPIFDFCEKVEKLTHTPNPTRRAIEELRKGFEEVNQEGIQALEKAKRQLEQLEQNAPARPPIFEERHKASAPQPSIATTAAQPTSSQRKWSKITVACSAVALALAFIYQRIFGTR